jgi:hypothetical protein
MFKCSCLTYVCHCLLHWSFASGCFSPLEMSDVFHSCLPRETCLYSRLSIVIVASLNRVVVVVGLCSHSITYDFFVNVLNRFSERNRHVARKTSHRHTHVTMIVFSSMTYRIAIDRHVSRIEYINERYEGRRVIERSVTFR